MKGFIIIILLMFVSQGFSQIISNPSFEGSTGRGNFPSGWSSCDEYSTPDTEPCESEINRRPSNGNTFITLVARGSLSPYANHCEDIQTKLLEPLEIGICYSFSIDLAKSSSYGHDTWDYGWVWYRDSVVLRVYGASSSCEETELFVETAPITHTDWETYDYVITPTISKIDYLVLKIDYVSMPIYFGNMQLDNIKMEKLEPIIDNPEITIEYGESIELSVEEGVAYSWTPEVGLSCTDCQNPIATPTSSIIYEATITKEQCGLKEFFPIIVNPFIPNVITPNGDGKNDVFHIDGIGPEASIIITDRHGKVLYETNSYNNDWDGTYKGGERLPANTYWYSLLVKPNEEAIIGFIYLMY